MTLAWDINHICSNIDPVVVAGTTALCSLVCVGVVKWEKKKQESKLSWKHCIGILAFALYVGLLLWYVILSRKMGEEFGVALIPFWSYWETFANANDGLGVQLVFNIIAFVPWGVLGPLVFIHLKKLKCLFVSVLTFAALMELLQLIFRCGTCEFDDIFNNVLGALLGYSIWKLCSSRRKRGNIVS